MSNKLIIFDCDGVLVDSEIISCRIACEEFNKHGFDISYEAYVRSFSGKSRASVMTHVENACDIVLPSDFSDELEQKILGGFSQSLRSLSDIDKAIEQSPNRCIASGSSLNRIRHSLAVTGLDSCFSLREIFSASMVRQGKPAPDLFLLAADKMGARPQDCWVIEDSIAGVTAAQKAGMRCLGFFGGSHITDEDHSALMLNAGAEKTFSNMSELAHFLAGITNTPT